MGRLAVADGIDAGAGGTALGSGGCPDRELCGRAHAPPAPNVLPGHKPLTSRENGSPQMATFLIERNLPGASQLTPEQPRAIPPTSNALVHGLGVAYTWRQSYVAGDKIYCVHE